MLPFHTLSVLPLWLGSALVLGACRGAPAPAPEAELERHKAIVRRWSEELGGNLTIADEIVAPDHLRHEPGALAEERQ